MDGRAVGLTTENPYAVDQCSVASVLDISMESEQVCLMTNGGDVFSHAADSEEIELSKVEIVLELYRDFGHDGVVAYVSHKRGQAPLAQHLTDKHIQALKALSHFPAA